MTDISDADIDRAARAVAARLNRLIEFQIPESDPRYMEVTRRTKQREWQRARAERSGKSDPSSPSAERLGL